MDKGPDVKKVLEVDGRGRRRKRVIKIAVAAAAVAGIAVFVASRIAGDGDAGPTYTTEALARGDLKVVITATGTIQARDTVEVGAEVTGRVVELHADFNDKVEAGQVIARIDPTQSRQDVTQAEARLLSAQASMAKAKLAESEATNKLARGEALAKDGLVSAQELETLRTTAATARVSTKAARASLAEVQASVDNARTRLEKTTIRSPIAGIVLNRKVEKGQTVTAGFSTPVLFQLASDLSEMKLTAAVDEADVGRIEVGQEATFTVDAFPSRTFTSKVLSVRNVATTTQNVVTYEVILSAPNPDQKLRPGMTATTTIVTASVKDGLLVTNAALRFQPQKPAAPDAKAAEAKKSGGVGIPGFSPPRGMRTSGRSSPAAAPRAAPTAVSDRGTIWTLENGEPRPHRVRKGETDGEKTEVLDSDLEPGALVITGSSGTSPSTAATKTTVRVGPPPGGGGPGGP